MIAIETQSLTHRYGSASPVLEGLNLQVPMGSIYGFLGKNGAGKTTTMRLLLGLLKLQAGKVRYFGKDFAADRIATLRQVGSLIETPSLYGNLTASENLRIWQRIYQCPKGRMDEVLKLVGLADTGKKRAAQFSLGMKQRLSLAVALLHNPKLLILDEPTNGLDPEGIREMRSLLRHLNQETGLTILVSSHLLAEVEKMATHLGILHQGRLAFQGPMKELNAQQARANGLLLRTEDDARALAFLQAEGFSPIASDQGIHLPPLSPSETAQMNARLVNQAIGVWQLQPQQNDLESIYMQILQS